MKKLMYILGVTLLLCACGGGSGASKVLDEFKDLVETAEKKKATLSVDEFKALCDNFNAKAEALGIEEIDVDEFSLREKLELVAYTARWTAVMMQAVATEVERETGIAIEDLPDAMEKEAARMEEALQQAGLSEPGAEPDDFDTEAWMEELERLSDEEALKELEKNLEDLGKALQGIE